MKTVFGSRRHHYLKVVSISLIVMALVAGMASCDGGGGGVKNYSLTMAVDPEGSGTATDLIDKSPYPAGTVVSIQAVAATGYRFVNWTAPAGTSADPNAARTTFTIPDRSTYVTANFARAYSLTMAVNPPRSGWATDLTNASPYPAGTVVSIQAATTQGGEFLSWTASAGTFANASTAHTTFTMPAQDVTVTANLVGGYNAAVAVLGDYGSQLTNLLIDNDIWAEERSWDVVDDIDEYRVVVVNLPHDPGEGSFLDVLDAASDNGVGVVFTSSYSTGLSWGISLLQRHRGDPAGQSVAYMQGDVYYRVTQAHPIFEGWDVGDEITIITGGDHDHAWFWDYSGDSIAEVGSELGGIQDEAVAVGRYGGSTHVLLASLGPQSWTNVPQWTDDGRTIFVNAVAYAALDSGIEGFVSDEETENPLEGAKVWVHETGQAAYTDETGFYRLRLPPGSYNVTAEAFGYYEQIAGDVEVMEHVVTSRDFVLTPMPSGFIGGTITNADTGDPIEGGRITLLGSTLSTTTDEFGYYIIEAPTGTYDVTARASGYQPSIFPDVSVTADETVTVDFELVPALQVAVLGDYGSQLTDLLIDNGIWAEERTWDVVDDIDLYGVVVVNLPQNPGEGSFLDVLNAASDNGVGVVFTSSYPKGESWGISLLQWHRGDPAGQGHGYYSGDVYYKVTEPHPIFEGWDVGDEITIITGGDRDYSWFWDYSGDTIAEVGSESGGIQGDAVAVSTYGRSTHVLLSSLGPQWDTNVPHWTDDGRLIFINAVLFAGGI